MTRRDWRNYILGNSAKGVNPRKTEAIIQGWIQAYAKEAGATISALKSTKELQVYPQKAEVLLRRWSQIEHLCAQAIKTMSNEPGRVMD